MISLYHCAYQKTFIMDQELTHFEIIPRKIFEKILCTELPVQVSFQDAYVFEILRPFALPYFRAWSLQVFSQSVKFQ